LRLNLFGLRPRARHLASFTLIELLTVMAVIAILASLILYAGSSVMNKAARSRAASEIQAMATACEGYKTDNGIYPQLPATLATTFTTNTYAGTDGSGSGGNYQQSSQILYETLSNQTNFNDIPVPGTRAYMSFKANQLGNTATAASTAYGAGTSTYIKDPWNNSYAYSTATNSAGATPYNGVGFFDLWSTGGILQAKLTATPSLTNAWISNWQ
jgi:prepilin-type N-terminal cleavage/methylation domain-containing protein